MKKPLSSSSLQPVIGIIANSTSPANRDDLIAELGQPRNGFFNPLKFSFKELRGEIIPLDIQPNEILEREGMARAKAYMFRAVDYLVSRGVQVICFTASTKRLPGKFGQEVKKLYPNIIFSIGDNVTMISYLTLLDYFLTKLDVETDQLACLGAGFLGVNTMEHLIKNKCRHINLVSEQKLYALKSNVSVVKDISELPSNIKLFMSCSHKYQLDAEILSARLASEAVILDAAVPPGISYDVFQKLPTGIRRFDVGDFFLEDISYDFPAKILNFPAIGFWFGCWTEAVILAIAKLSGLDLMPYNFFEVNQTNQTVLEPFLRQEKVAIPLINFYNNGQGKIQFFDF